MKAHLKKTSFNVNCVAGSSSKMKCLNISLIMTATPAAGIQLTFHSIAIKCFHQITFQRLSGWFSHKTTRRMAANGNHREWVWDAQVSPVIRAVGLFFNEPIPAKSLAAMGVEGKGGETSLHPALPRAVSRDLTPTQPPRPSFPPRRGEIQGSNATHIAARSVPA